MLFRAAELMRQEVLELSALMTLEAGKTRREANGDADEAIDFLEYYGREMLRLDKARRMGSVPGEHNVYFYQPRGVALVIAPWNFPLAILTGMTSAALVAGNPVIVKPAGPTPVIAAQMVRILSEAGAPPGTVNFLPSPGGEVGDFLVRHAGVDLIAFTGSMEVGLGIISSSAQNPSPEGVKKVVAEMGGKNAVIVDTDADLDVGRRRGRRLGLPLRRPEVLGRLARDRPRGGLRRLRAPPRRGDPQPARSARRRPAARASARSSPPRRRRRSRATSPRAGTRPASRRRSSRRRAAGPTTASTSPRTSSSTSSRPPSSPRRRSSARSSP